MTNETRIEDFCSSILRGIAVVLFIGICIYSIVTRDWQPPLIIAPFLLVLAPGYLELLPKGGLKHGKTCTCAEPDQACEIGFWCEHLQRLSLIIPLILFSIFLGSLWNSTLEHAVSETVTAAAAVSACLSVLALLVTALVKTR